MTKEILNEMLTANDATITNIVNELVKHDKVHQQICKDYAESEGFKTMLMANEGATKGLQQALDGTYLIRKQLQQEYAESNRKFKNGQSVRLIRNGYKYTIRGAFAITFGLGNNFDVQIKYLLTYPNGILANGSFNESDLTMVV